MSTPTPNYGAIQTVGPTPTPCYRLSFNGFTKVVSKLVPPTTAVTRAQQPVIVTGTDATGALLATYAQVQALATSLGLTGLPAQVEGQP